MPPEFETSAETMEVAEPSIETADGADYVDTEVEDYEAEPVSEEPDSGDDPEPEKPERDFEKDRAYAELRREKEAAERRLNEMNTWVSQQYGESHGLHTWDDYQKALAEEKRRQEYSEQGLDYDVVKKAVKEELDSHPEVLRAKEANQRAAVQAEIAEFNKAFPDYSFAEPQEIYKLPNGDKVAEKIARGYSLVDAFETTNRDAILEKRTRAAQQATRNNINSKQHIKPSGGSGGDIDALSVPDDVMANYRKMFAKDLKSGKMKESDFINHYKKSKK